jgi:hypothetical protein
MAIYSFNHDTFGRSPKGSKTRSAAANAAYNARHSETRMAHDAAGNAAYNAREEVTYAVRSHIIPTDPKEAEAWFRAQEAGERKNARMSDRFIGALPRELTPEQSIEAVEQFCMRITQNRIPWHLALHLELEKKAEPDWNPHAHILFRDRDIETGKRFLYTSAGPKERRQLDEKGIRYWTTKDFRVAWGEEMNHALERAGKDARIDHRSLKEQGIDRDPQIHVGPGSRSAAEKGFNFTSKDQELGQRTIPYTVLDRGTRADHNAAIKAGNAERAGQGLRRYAPEPRAVTLLRHDQAKIRTTMYAEQKQDRAALKAAQQKEIAQHSQAVRAEQRETRAKAFADVKERFAPQWQELRAAPSSPARKKSFQQLRQDQKAAYAEQSGKRLTHITNSSASTLEAMHVRHAEQRRVLQQAHADETASLMRQHAAERLAARADHRADRITASLQNNQGMAQQQTAAIQLMQLHARSAPSPEHHINLARTEYQTRQQIRSHLNEERQSNLSRAGIAQPSQLDRAAEGRSPFIGERGHGGDGRGMSTSSRSGGRSGR